MLQHVYWMSPIGWYHALAFGVLLPAWAVRRRARAVPVGRPPVNRVRHFRTTSITLAAFGALSILTARAQTIDLFRAGPDTASAASIGTAVALYAAAVAFMRPRWRRAVERRARVVHLFMPSRPAERAWWIAVSVLAGVTEEITWRGVQPILAAFVLGSPPAGVLATAAAFGAAHIMQGWRSAVLIVVFALGFQSLVWLSGSLFLAMLVHAAYDITAGLTYGRLGRELGYGIEPGPVEPAPARES